MIQNIIMRVHNNYADLSFDKFGCRVVQKLLEINAIINEE